jgi:3-oxoacyl-[acyl-carrier protein] reductase
MNVSLSGKVALVTGGGRGIGAAISRALAELGAAVVVNYNRSSEQAEALRAELAAQGRAVTLAQADVSKPDAVQAMFGLVRATHQRLDILVNNAGVVRDTLLLTMRDKDWDAVYEVILRGAFLCTRQAAEMMMSSHAGKIINIASVSAVAGGRGQTNYVAAKAGLLGFTRACAIELAPKNIQVNAVLPGMIETQMSHRVRRAAGEEILSRIPAGRLGKPEDIAAMVAFLATPLADYITGQAICVDGGAAAL